MLVILKCVTSAPSAAFRLITRPEVVCVSSLVVALVTDGVSATGLTVMVAVARLPPKPALVLFTEACTWKLNVVVGLNRLAAGVNFNPALPWATVMKSPLLICVVPLFWNKVPLAIPVILKCVTSAPSAALRLMTRPDPVCVSSLVVALVTDGVSATALTVIVAVARPPPNPASVLFSDDWIWKLKVVVGLNRFALGVNFNP